ncbi:MAG TPA: ATP-binding protein, partial [Verrucomicrobiae bacterium]|nr:ATP-binding protein [Verrucomicrobiae bacterium]
MSKFTVDTHLFRELGALLVGRDSTALVELIKNAYDADASVVTVHGENIDDRSNGRIIITDDGVGMTPGRFELGFLRIASRVKEQGSRKSPRYKRRFTGAKGIGRLAAHKLASLLEITSIPSKEVLEEERQAAKGEEFKEEGVQAVINWNLVESVETLDKISETRAVIVNPVPLNGNRKEGTRIDLQKLRRKWAPVDRAKFFAEIQTFSPPEIFIKSPAPHVTGRPLFETPRIQDAKASDPGCRIHLTGDFESGEDYWGALIQSAQWIIEIDASKEKVWIQILPTKPTMAARSNAKPFKTSIDHP